LTNQHWKPWSYPQLSFKVAFLLILQQSRSQHARSRDC